MRVLAFAVSQTPIIHQKGKDGFIYYEEMAGSCFHCFGLCISRTFVGCGCEENNQGEFEEGDSSAEEEMPRASEKSQGCEKMEKKYQKEYLRQKSKYSAILLANIRSRSPLVVSSSFPLRGDFLIEGAWDESNVLFGKWSGEVSLTNEYRWVDGLRCRVAKYSKHGATPAYKKYKKASVRANKLQTRYNYAKWRVSYLKKLPKSKLKLKNSSLVATEKKKLNFHWNYENNEETKWSVSNPQIAQIVKKGSGSVTLKGKKQWM